MSVKNDMKRSSVAFESIVWPAISPLCGRGDIKMVEATTNKEFTNELDILAGIDAWQVIESKSVIRGVASRVQFGDKSWDSFTIRYQRHNGTRTEYSKRIDAIANIDKGYLLPHLTIQAYLDTHGEVLLSAGAVKTIDLFGAAERIVDRCVANPTKKYRDGGIRTTSNADFIWVPWFALEGEHFRRWEPR